VSVVLVFEVYASVFPDPPDVHRDEQQQERRQDDAVQHVEAQERVLVDGGAAEQQELHVFADERHRVGHVRADRDAPVGELVPRQQVARVGEQDRDEEQHDPDDPVELARRPVRAREEDAHHVQHHERDHRVRRPPVQVAQERAHVDHEREVLHVLVGARHRRVVIEHQEDAGHHQHERRGGGQAAQVERLREGDRAQPHLHRVDVQEEVGEDGQRTVPVRVGRAVPHD